MIDKNAPEFPKEWGYTPFKVLSAPALVKLGAPDLLLPYWLSTMRAYGYSIEFLLNCGKRVCFSLVPVEDRSTGGQSFKIEPIKGENN